MTDDKQNAPQWADVASGEIMETIQTNLINRMLDAEIVTIEEAVTLGNDLYRLIASTYARHAEQRDMAVAEAVREEMLKFEESADLDGNYDPTYYNGWLAGITDYARHTESIDLAPIIASVTNRAPERCVWAWNDRLMMYDTGCGVDGAAKGEAKFCPNCGREIEVREADDPNKTFYTSGYGKEADDDD